jgi:hypothetical protein
VVTPTDRLSLAPDVHSDADGASKANGAAPLPRLVTGIVTGPLPGATPAIANRATENEVSDMHESTRTSGKPDSGTQASAPKITPAASSETTVTTTEDLR